MIMMTASTEISFRQHVNNNSNDITVLFYFLLHPENPSAFQAVCW